MNCPHCGSDLGSNLGVSLQDQVKSSPQTSDPSPGSSVDPNRARVRGKARDYSPAFETAWRAYGRREEKLRAYGEWIIQARLTGGETLLLPLILASLKWQGPLWAMEGWKFAPYFERYLKRRKWEDEQPAPAPRPSSLPPWKQAERNEEDRKRDERNREAAARERIQREQQEALKKAGFA